MTKLKKSSPAILFSIFPFIIVFILEGFSPFTFVIGVLSIGALLSIYLPAKIGKSL